MKKKLIVITILAALVGFVYAAASTTENAYKKTTDTGADKTRVSKTQGLLATNTADVTNEKIGTLYGYASAIEVYFTGVDADGFTVTVNHVPVGGVGTVAWPADGYVTKLTKLVTAASGTYGFETTSVNSNVAIGADFTGYVYITVSDFDGTRFWINVINDKDAESAVNINY
jgi:hypothetical protein